MCHRTIFLLEKDEALCLSATSLPRTRHANEKVPMDIFEFLQVHVKLSFVELLIGPVRLLVLQKNILNELILRDSSSLDFYSLTFFSREYSLVICIDNIVVLMKVGLGLLLWYLGMLCFGNKIENNEIDSKGNADPKMNYKKILWGSGKDPKVPHSHTDLGSDLSLWKNDPVSDGIPLSVFVAFLRTLYESNRYSEVVEFTRECLCLRDLPNRAARTFRRIGQFSSFPGVEDYDWPHEIPIHDIVIRLDSVLERVDDLFEMRSFDRGLWFCREMRKLDLGRLENSLRTKIEDSLLYELCIGLYYVCRREGEETENQFFERSFELVSRLEAAECPFAACSALNMGCQIRSMRAEVYLRLRMFGDCIHEATRAIQLRPRSLEGIRARISRCSAYGRLRQFDDMGRDLISLRESTRLGLVERVDRVAALESFYLSFAYGNPGMFPDLFALRAASLVGESSLNYQRRQSTQWNVSRMFGVLSDILSFVERRASRHLRESQFAKQLRPHLCLARRYVDALVHLAFSVEEERRLFGSFSSEPSRIAVLRVSDTMKCPLVLSLEQKNRLLEHQECSLTILDRGPDFLPPDGFFVVYHLVVECELAPPCLLRWVILDGTVVHSDRLRIPDNFLELVHFFPSLYDALGRLRIESRELDKQTDVCRALYEFLLGRLEPFFADVHHITFVPDFHLCRVSFPTLMNKMGQFLIEAHSVSVSSSLRMVRLNSLRRRDLFLQSNERDVASTSFPVLVCGEAVKPGGNDPDDPKIDGIVQTLSSHSTVVVCSHDQFTPSVVKEFCRSAHPRIVHVLGHGSAENDPEETEDVLDQFQIHGEIESSNGTVISARDVAWHYDFSGTDLVFLNACSVGYGKLQKTGIMGFNQACFQAGCPSVIAPIWQVNTSVALLYESAFYKQFLSGDDKPEADKAEALRTVILEFLRSSQFVTYDGVTLRTHTNPVIWGSYQLFGNRF